MEFTLRPFCVEDAPVIAAYANNPKIAQNLRDAFPFPYTLDDAADFIDICIKGEGASSINRAIDVGGKAVGSIGVFVKDDVYRRTAEIGYWLAEPYWNQQIMTNAVQQIVQDAFSRYDIVRIFAEVFAWNKASQRVLQKAGFTNEGTKKQSIYKNGTVGDACIYALLKEDLPS